MLDGRVGEVISVVARCCRVVEAACWTHARRHFHDELLANGSPLAREATLRMQPLFANEAEIHGQPAEARLAARQARSAPVMAELHTWLEATRGGSSASRT